jgi:hypothetical protein
MTLKIPTWVLIGFSERIELQGNLDKLPIQAK